MICSLSCTTACSKVPLGITVSRLLKVKGQGSRDMQCQPHSDSPKSVNRRYTAVENVARLGGEGQIYHSDISSIKYILTT